MKKDWIDTSPPSKTKRALIALGVLALAGCTGYITYIKLLQPEWLRNTLCSLALIIVLGSAIYIGGLSPGRCRTNFNNKDWE